MIIKCHALSQLTFANQFQNILGKDIKRIEKICYKYLWNGGPERVKRSTFKLSKLDGGIDGIDVESFLLAIKIRQFIKADLNCEPLRYVQNLFPYDEDISRSSRVCLSRLLRHCWKNCDILDLSLEERTWLVNIDLRNFFKPGCKTDIFLQHLTSPTLNGLIGHGRSDTNKVIKSLPIIFRQALNLSLPIIRCNPVIVVKNKPILINKVSSKNLQFAIKSTLGKTVQYRISSKYDSLFIGEQAEKSSWFNLWKIRNPILRSCRLKVMYKDIYSQERRFRFGLTDSPKCLICGEIETVEHQLFVCKNARRLWQIYNNIFAEQISFEQSVLAQSALDKELVKAVINKLLIQIDRSRHLSIQNAIMRIRQFIQLEVTVSKNIQLVKLMNTLDGLVR